MLQLIVDLYIQFLVIIGDQSPFLLYIIEGNGDELLLFFLREM